VAIFWDWVSLLQHAPIATRGTVKAIQMNEDGTYSSLRVEFDENGDDGFIPPTLVESHLISQIAQWGDYEEDSQADSALSFRQLSTRSLSMLKNVSSGASEATSNALTVMKRMSSVNMMSKDSKKRKDKKKGATKEEQPLFTVGGRVSARLPRTDEEEDIYQKGLDSLHVWFGHRKCFKLLFTSHPSDSLPEDATQYIERPDYNTSAWTILERCVSCLVCDSFLSFFFRSVTSSLFTNFICFTSPPPPSQSYTLTRPPTNISSNDCIFAHIYICIQRYFTCTAPGLVFDMSLVNTLPLSDLNITFRLVNQLASPPPKLCPTPEDFLELIR
jgi:hypothetical protein